MTFEEDVEFFKSIDAELATKDKGKFVLIKDRKVQDIFSNIEDAHKESLKRFGVTDVVIAQIGTAAPLNYLASVA
ncbi:MAG: hypothetical protein ACRD6W_14860 [Nitrososphaerales archaeon]